MQITYYHFSSVDSTNAWAKRHKNTFGADEFAVISSEEQTQGRGRFMRPWHSPKWSNLYLTLAFFDTFFPPFFFSQLASLCLEEVLQEAGIAAKIKWPNDLLVDDKKIAGILTEVENGELEHCPDRFIILGIGLNVNMTSTDLASISQAATSMFLQTDHIYSISTIQEQFVKKFVKKLGDAKCEGYYQLQHEWHEKISWMHSKEITVQLHDTQLQGRIHDIESTGTLILLLDDGTTHTLLSGDISWGRSCTTP